MALPEKLKLAKDAGRAEIFFSLARVKDSGRILLGASDGKIYDIDLLAEKPEFKSWDSHQSYVTGVVLALLSAFSTGATLQFTHAWYGFQIIAVYGFFSMCAFGAIYYIVPRVAGCEWLSVRLIRNHFWFSVYGIGTIVVMSLVAGLQQGGDLNSPEMWDQDFMQLTLNARGYMVARAVAWALITWSNLWFLIHLMLMVAGLGRRSSAPTLLEREHGDITLPHGANA